MKQPSAGDINSLNLFVIDNVTNQKFSIEYYPKILQLLCKVENDIWLATYQRNMILSRYSYKYSQYQLDIMNILTILKRLKFMADTNSALNTVACDHM